MDILFLVLSMVSGFGLGFTLWDMDERMAIVLLTTYLWTVLYGSTYYQIKWTMKLFRKYK